jgi:pyruvate/2-oxoacid:ferredoxin oxidoreductase alpha subunit
MQNLIPQIAKEWKKPRIFYGDLLELQMRRCRAYSLINGAIGAESKIAIDEMQKTGNKIGLARVRVIRPFPTEEIRKVGKQADLIVIDRNISIGLEGAVFNEVKAALFGVPDAKATGFIAGLGGKDVTYQDIMTMCQKAMKGSAPEQEWYGMED